jgi:16S rRNA (guanine966-N2)-methyltransferase
MKQNSLRIIGGKWRGRKITFPSVDGLRPTHDRIRETLFNWLMHDVVDANCLDLFAGSGALGLEALSRGAQQVTFIDTNVQVCQSLRDILSELSANAIVLHDSFESLSTPSPFDLVFLDPPFGSGLLSPAIAWLEAKNILTDSARVYIEVEKGGLPQGMPSNWECSRSKSTSTLDYYLFDRLSV